MQKQKRLMLRRERLRTLVPAQLGRVLGGENTESFNLGCDSYDCNTVTEPLNTTNNTGTNTLNTTVTNTVTDPLNVVTP